MRRGGCGRRRRRGAGESVAGGGAWERASAAPPGALPVLIRVPLQSRGTYRVQLRFPHDRTPGGRSVVEIDLCGGEVLQVVGMRGADFGNTSGWMQRSLPTGAIFGWPTRVVVCLVGVALILQAISGRVMGWRWGRRRLWLERCRKKPQENPPSSGRDGGVGPRVMRSPGASGRKKRSEKTTSRALEKQRNRGPRRAGDGRARPFRGLRRGFFSGRLFCRRRVWWRRCARRLRR